MRRSAIVLIASLLLISVVGSGMTYSKVNEEAAFMRGQVMSQARLAAHGVNASDIMSLSGSEADLGTPEYERLKDLMTCYYHDMPGVRFVYLVGMLSNGTPFFYVDSEPEDSPDYSPPGQLYTDIPGVFDRTFEGKEAFDGPHSDSWGEFVTGMVPIVNPSNDQVVAVLGVDLDVNVWNSQLISGGLPFAMATLLVATMVVAFYAIEQGREKEGARQARYARELKQANDKLHIMNSITRHDINNQVTILNGYLALAKDRMHDPAVSAYIDRMLQATGNIQQQIGFTKDYQEIGMKAPAWADVSGHLRKAFSMLDTRGIALEDRTEGLEVLADPMFGKVFYNLIDNSLRHGKKVSRITVSASHDDGVLSIIYQDDGVGIRDEDRALLFSVKDERGRGLGLLLIKEILAITGVRIVERGLGSGARFEISVPDGAWRSTKERPSEGPEGDKEQR